MKVKFKMEALQFSCQCRINLIDGSSRTFNVELPPIKINDKSLLDVKEIIYKDEKGNIFTYDKMIYKNIEYIPRINFDVFNITPEIFNYQVEVSYYRAFREMSKELLIDEIIYDLNEFKKKDLFLEHLTSKHSPYYKEFDRVYFDNCRNMKNVTEIEKEFLRKYGYRKITRYTAFLILLYRNKDNNDFHYTIEKKFFDKYNEKIEEEIMNIYIQFRNAYKQFKKYHKDKSLR